jgi:hypothetical protein
MDTELMDEDSRLIYQIKNFDLRTQSGFKSIDIEAEEAEEAEEEREIEAPR